MALSFTDWMRGAKATVQDIRKPGRSQVNTAIRQSLSDIVNPKAVYGNITSGDPSRVVQGLGQGLALGAGTVLGARAGLRAPAASKSIVQNATRNIRQSRINPEDFFLRPQGYTPPAASAVPTMAAQLFGRIIPSSRTARTIAGGAALGAPQIVSAAEKGLDTFRGLEEGTTQAPETVDRIAAAARLAAGVGLAGLGARGALKKGAEFRSRVLPALTSLVGGTSLYASGMDDIGTLGTGKTPETRDAEAAAAAASVDDTAGAPLPPAIELPSQMEQVQQMQEESLRQYEQQLIAEDQALDALFEQALQESLAARGATTQADIAADPLLQQELAAINQQYTNAKQNIQNNYEAALNQVQGYQTQADQMMQELAAAQLAGIETAAGQAMAPAPGTGLSAEEAAAAGISLTAVGGSGITGAAQIGGLAGVSAAQSAASRIAAGSMLSEQLASGRLDQAALETALEQSLIDAERGARITAAERQSIERERQRAANIDTADMKLRAVEARRAEKASKREAIASARLQNNQRLADRISGMSAEEYRRFVGGDVTAASPAWAKKRIPIPPNGTGESNNVIKGAPSVSVEQANTVLQLFEAQMGEVVATGMDRNTAITTIFKWIQDATATSGFDVIPVLRAAGYPVTPEEIYNKLAPQR